MSALARAMQGFMRALQRWTDTIKRLAYLDTLTLKLRGHVVHVDATWKDGIFHKEYTKDMVFSQTGTRYMERKKICRHADELVAEILRARGI